MSGHKLNDVLIQLGVVQNDDNLQHYGVKGMKWGEKKEEIEKELEGTEAGEAIDEAEAKIEEAKQAAFERKKKKQFDKKVKNIKKKISEISEEVRRTGQMILKSIFGESKPKKSKSSFVSQSYLDDTLKHAGVLGMKWGVTKEEPKKAAPKKAAPKKAAPKKAAPKKAAPKKPVSKKPVSKSAESSYESFKNGYRKRQAKVDVYHIDAKTGKYTHQNTAAKALRIVDRTLDMAKGVAILGGVGASILLNMSANNDGNDILKHYGTKGMRWGVRRNLKKLSPGKARTDFVKNYDKKWADKVNKNPKATKVAKVAAKDAKKMTKQLNDKYKEEGYTFGKNSLKSTNMNNKKNALAKNRYDREVKDIVESSLDNAAFKIYGNSPSRVSQVNITRRADGTLTAEIAPRSNAKITKQQIKLTDYDNRQAKKQARQDKKDAKVQHAAPTEAPEFDGVVWILKEDADGFVTDFEVVGDTMQQSFLEDTLLHFGFDKAIDKVQ